MTFIDSSKVDVKLHYKLLSGTIIPRAVAIIVTRSEQGVINAAPFSFFTGVSTNPPVVGVSIVREDNNLKHTARNLQFQKEAVIHIATEDIIEEMNLMSAPFFDDESEVNAVGMKIDDSTEYVRVPKIANMKVSMEVRLRQVIPFENNGVATSEFYLLDVLAYHIDDSIHENLRIDAISLNPVARLSGSFYGSMNEVFELKRPKTRVFK